MKTDKPRIYWTVKSAHYGSNRYIFDTLSLAETEIARLKKQYPNEKTELTQLIEYTAVEQLEQELKEKDRLLALVQKGERLELKDLEQKLAAQEAEIAQLNDEISIARKDAAENREEKIKLQIQLGIRNA